MDSPCRRHGLLALLFLCLAVMAPAVHAAPPLVVAVLPQYAADRVQRDWTPALNEVAKATGIPLKLKFYASFREFEAALLKGEPDLAYMNPYHAVMANKAQGYLPIIRNDAEQLTGILVVRHDSPLQNVRQLDGATIGFPDPNAFAASLYMRALLAETLKMRIAPLYVKSHANVYRQVVNGRLPAGGGLRMTLTREPAELQAQLRVIYETPPVYSHPIAVHPRLPVAQRSALQQAFLALGQESGGAVMLVAIQIPVPVSSSYADYAPLAKLGLERFVDLHKD